MSEPVNSSPPARATLSEAIAAFITTRMASLSAASESPQAPEDGQIWGAVGSLMGLSKAERQERQRDILGAFLPAWIAAGGTPRIVSPKKARVQKRKLTIKQIKSKRSEIEKIAAANQRVRKPADPAQSGP
jgi:hypothetical protein